MHAIEMLMVIFNGTALTSQYINNYLYAYEIFVNNPVVVKGGNCIISPARRLHTDADAARAADRGKPQACLGLREVITWNACGRAVVPPIR